MPLAPALAQLLQALLQAPLQLGLPEALPQRCRREQQGLLLRRPWVGGILPWLVCRAWAPQAQAASSSLEGQLQQVLQALRGLRLLGLLGQRLPALRPAAGRRCWERAGAGRGRGRRRWSRGAAQGQPLALRLAKLMLAALPRKHNQRERRR